MKKSFLATVAALGVLSTSALAYNADCPNRANGFQGKGAMMQGQMMQGQQMQGPMMRGQMMRGQHMRGQMMQGRGGMHYPGMHQGVRRGMGMLATLDLSDEQRYEISLLRDEMRLEMRKAHGPNTRASRMGSFIGEDGFDKEAFIKQSNERHEKMMELRAEHMEKVFNILTKEQRKKLQDSLAN